MAIRGGDTGALRAYNEKLILDAIRRGGPMSRAQIARATGLSAQAASVIVGGLVGGGMLLEGRKVRGRVGQPMTPLALNPHGALSVGVKIGRRGVEATLVDFLGAPVRTWRAGNAALLPGPTMALAVEGARRMIRGAPRAARGRLVGVGLAAPGRLDLWASELGLAADALAGWRDVDPAAALAAATGLPALLCNDATAACAAELAVGGGLRAPDMLYIHLGAFVGGGVVVQGRLQHGATGGAGAIGSMPMPGPGAQLIHRASLLFLERALTAAGLDGRVATAPPAAGPAAATVFARWLEGAAPALARAIVAACSVLEFGCVVLDGPLRADWRDRLIDATRDSLATLNRAGLGPVTLEAGALGGAARVLGAALLPLHARFSPRPETLSQRAPPMTRP